MSILKILFISLVVMSILVVLVMLFPDTGIMQGPGIFILWILHALSGLGLVILTIKQKITGKIKTFLLIAGFSAIGFLVGVVLHNVFYALGTLTEEIALLKAFLGFLEGSFFLLAALLCPLGLLVGVIGTLVLWKQMQMEK